MPPDPELSTVFGHLAATTPDVARLLDGFSALGLGEAWIVAGCLAQGVWNQQAGLAAGTGIVDLDIVYFDAADLSAEAEAAHERRLRARFPALAARLDVKNQARVHLWYGARFGRGIAPYPSAVAAIGSFPTTATAVGLCVAGGGLQVAAPFGLQDLFAGVVRANRRIVSEAVFRAKAARWAAIWPHLRVLPWEMGVAETGLQNGVPTPD